MAKHLTLAERQVLQRMIKAKRSKAEIGKLLNRHRSTIYRELRRNSNLRGYHAQGADRWARKRREACRRPHKLQDVELRLDVNERLAKAWSPDQIAGRLKREYPQQPCRQVSAPTIYAWIKRRAPSWRRWLRQAHRKLYRPFKRPKEVCIEGRPATINGRHRYGDWEGDTIVSRGRRSGLVTLVERKSGLVRIDLLNNLTSMTTMRAASRCLADLPRTLRRSTTFDNGPEFAAYTKLSEWLGLKVYFAAPHCAWQRGSNENLNGLVRQFYPKGTDFKKLARRDVKRVEQLLNDRPRRRLSYRTPNEVIHKKLCRN